MSTENTNDSEFNVNAVRRDVLIVAMLRVYAESIGMDEDALVTDFDPLATDILRCIDGYRC